MSLVRKQAPDFTAPSYINGEFQDVTLSALQGQWVVLMFYPLDFTFNCPTECIGFSERNQEFADINCKVLGLSIDSKFVHRAWVNTARTEGGVGALNIPLVSDVTHQISRDYGVLIEGDDEEAGVALRGLFIIDPAGKVRSATVNDLPVSRSVDETLRLVKAFQFVEEHGEVCPLNWQPGKRTIDTDNHLDFFAAEYAAGASASADEPAAKKARS